jgi:hypothetical protein
LQKGHDKEDDEVACHVCDCPAVSCDLNDPAKSRYFQAITATSSLLFHQDLLIDREIDSRKNGPQNKNNENITIYEITKNFTKSWISVLLSED